MTKHKQERDSALLTMGEGIADIAMRSIRDDRDLDDAEVAAIAFLCRNALIWCEEPAA